MRKILFAFFVASIALGASAAQFSNFYVIPVAAHVTGANGTSWRTDLSIQNIQDSPVTVEIAVVESGEGLLDNVFPVAVGPDNASSITVAAGGSVTLRDVLQNHRGRSETSGALLVGGDKAFAITSRTYDVTSSGGTFGHTVAAATDIASTAGADDATLFIPGIVQNAAFRTNLGLLMAAGAEPMTVTVRVNGADGGAIGTRSFTVTPGVTTHVQFGAPTVAPSAFDAGGAIVRITGGTGTVVAYAAVVDNLTGDASFISGGTAGAGAASPLRTLLARAMDR
jgi:hypothetical protein